MRSDNLKMRKDAVVAMGNQMEYDQFGFLRDSGSKPVRTFLLDRSPDGLDDANNTSLALGGYRVGDRLISTNYYPAVLFECLDNSPEMAIWQSGGVVDDTTASLFSTWSSQKTSEELNKKSSTYLTTANPVTSYNFNSYRDGDVLINQVNQLVFRARLLPGDQVEWVQELTYQPVPFNLLDYNNELDLGPIFDAAAVFNSELVYIAAGNGLLLFNEATRELTKLTDYLDNAFLFSFDYPYSELARIGLLNSQPGDLQGFSLLSQQQPCIERISNGIPMQGRMNTRYARPFEEVHTANTGFYYYVAAGSDLLKFSLNQNAGGLTSLATTPFDITTLMRIGTYLYYIERRLLSNVTTFRLWRMDFSTEVSTLMNGDVGGDLFITYGNKTYFLDYAGKSLRSYRHADWTFLTSVAVNTSSVWSPPKMIGSKVYFNNDQNKLVEFDTDTDAITWTSTQTVYRNSDKFAYGGSPTHLLVATTAGDNRQLLRIHLTTKATDLIPVLNKPGFVAWDGDSASRIIIRSYGNWIYVFTRGYITRLDLSYVQDTHQVTKVASDEYKTYTVVHPVLDRRPNLVFPNRLYSKVVFEQSPTVPLLPAASTDAASKSYVDTAVAGLSGGTTLPPQPFNATASSTFPSASATYRVTVAGTVQGVELEVGDVIFPLVAAPMAVAADWYVVQHNVDLATNSTPGLVRVGADADLQQLVTPTNTGKAATIGNVFAFWTWIKTQVQTIGEFWTFTKGLTLASYSTALTTAGQLARNVDSLLFRNSTGTRTVVLDDNLTLKRQEVRVTANAFTVGQSVNLAGTLGQSDTAANASLVGIVVAATGSQYTMATRGARVSGATIGLSANNKYYLKTDGTFQTTLPVSGLYVLVAQTDANNVADILLSDPEDVSAQPAANKLLFADTNGDLQTVANLDTDGNFLRLITQSGEGAAVAGKFTQGAFTRGNHAFPYLNATKKTERMAIGKNWFDCKTHLLTAGPSGLVGIGTSPSNPTGMTTANQLSEASGPFILLTQTTPVANGAVGNGSQNNVAYRGQPSSLFAGFFYRHLVWFPSAYSYDETGTTTGTRIFCGMNSTVVNTSTGPANSDDESGAHCAGFVRFHTNAGRKDTNWLFTTKDGTTRTTIDTGVAFAKDKLYLLEIECEPAGTSIYWTIWDLSTPNAIPVSGSVSTNLPGATTGLKFTQGMNMIDTLSRGYGFHSMMLETPILHRTTL